MKAMLAAFAAIIVISLGAGYALNTLPLPFGEPASSSVRLGN